VTERALGRSRVRPKCGAVVLGLGLLLALSCRAIIPGEETPAPGTPGAIPGFTRLTPGDSAMYAGPSWSPDGTRIVYSRSDYIHPGALPYTSELYVMDLQTGETLQLTHNEQEDRDPDWSPDGMRIVFVRAERAWPGALKTDREWLMTVRPDGSDERVLYQCSVGCWEPAWSPDGTRVAFSADLNMVIDADGSNPHKLDLRVFPFAAQPTWSPDGTRLAFAASKEAYTLDMERLPQDYLIEVNLITGEERSLAEINAYEPDWSPDGSRILFRATSYYGAYGDVSTLFQVPALGGRPSRLITEDLADDVFDPAWSPDGTRIALAYGSDIRISDLYVLDLAKYQNGKILQTASIPVRLRLD